MYIFIFIYFYADNNGFVSRKLSDIKKKENNYISKIPTVFILFIFELQVVMWDYNT